jgi:flagellar hook protein FlgE
MNVQMVALDGLSRAAAQLEATAARIARSADPADSVDLSAEMIALIEARNAFAINARVLRTANEMESHLVDLLA